MFRKLILGAMLLAPALARAQTPTHFLPGQTVPSAINSTFGSKADFNHAMPGGVPRNVDQRLLDVVSVLEYGAKCDGATDDTAAIASAIAAAAAAPGAKQVTFPAGFCVISTQISQTIGANHSVTLRGPGNGGILSTNGAGLAFTLTDPTAGFDASDLSINRTGTGQAGTALSVTATTGQNKGSTFDKLTFGANYDRTATWQVCLHLTGLSGPVIRANGCTLPNANGSGSGYGYQLSGSGTSRYSIDAKISDSGVVGGHAGIEADGAVQGIYVVNSEVIGSDWGVYAADSTGGTMFDELLTVENGHMNNVLGGVYASYFNQVHVAGVTFLHFNPVVGGTYSSVWVDHSAYVTVIGNKVNGNEVANERFFYGSNGTSYTISGNNVIGLAGDCIQTTASDNNVVAVGNNCQGVYSTAITLPGAQSVQVGNSVNGANSTIMTGFNPPDTTGANNIGAGSNPFGSVFATAIAIGPPGGPFAIMTANGLGESVTSGNLSLAAPVNIGNVAASNKPVLNNNANGDLTISGLSANSGLIVQAGVQFGAGYPVCLNGTTVCLSYVPSVHKVYLSDETGVNLMSVATNGSGAAIFKGPVTTGTP